MSLESALEKEARGQKVMGRQPKPIVSSSPLFKIKDVGIGLADLIYFLREMHVVPVPFILSVLFSGLAVVFNFFGIRLFIPLLQGMIRGDFSSVSDKWGIFQRLKQSFPVLFSGSETFFVFLVGLIVIAVLLKGACTYFSGLLTSQQIRKADSVIRRKIIERTLRFGKLAYDRFNTGAITHILLTASSSVTGQLRPLQNMVTQLMFLSMYLSVMCWISWKLTVASVGIFLLTHFSIRKLIWKIKEISHAHQQAELDLHSRISNVVSCITLVKVYAREKQEAANLSSTSDDEVELQYEADKRQMLMAPIQEASTMVSLLGVALLMVWFDPPGHADNLPHYFVFFFLARMCLPNLKAIANFRLSFARVEAQIQKLKDILLSDENKFIVASGERVFVGLHQQIEFKNLDFSYRENCPVLKSVSAVFPQGKMTAIVGPTGVGKTTLVSLIARLYDCLPGSLLLDGVDIRDYSLESLSKMISYVSQDPQLFNASLRENLLYGVEWDVSPEELDQVIRQAQLSNLIQGLPEGLQTIIGDRGVQLSGGEKQRVTIARALLRNAPILILDEATSALDAKTELSIQACIDETKQGRTTIVIAHRLSTILNADKVIVLEQGTVVEEGSLRDLIAKKGKFYSYWEAQKAKEKNFLEPASGFSAIQENA